MTAPSLYSAFDHMSPPMGKGDIALAMLPVANRDGRQFHHPDVLIPDRNPNRHIALGA